MGPITCDWILLQDEKQLGIMEAWVIYYIKTHPCLGYLQLCPKFIKHNHVHIQLPPLLLGLHDKGTLFYQLDDMSCCPLVWMIPKF
jgi:hypothetical protein